VIPDELHRIDRNGADQEKPMPPEVLPTRPEPVSADSWLIPTLAASPAGGFIGAHSLVIRGAEPVVVDTGCALARDVWAPQVFSVVEPEDVRWIFLSHTDHDHVGNLELILERCPQATLVGSFGIVGHLSGDRDLPLERMRWLDPGDSFDAGDRTLHLVRPPMFDSPTTRGLYDPKDRLLWAVDSFGALFPGATYDVEDIPADLYDGSFAALNSWNTPWLEWVDRDRYAAHVATTATLDLDVVVSAHGPVLRGHHVADAFARTLALAAAPPVPQPGQAMLDDLLRAVLGAAA
jgi:flavorubredoxin